MSLAGYQITVGRPGPDDLVGVWGQSPTSHRGEAVAEKSDASLVRVEDAWLRSLFPGRAKGDGPIGLLIDKTGLHFDPSTPSDLETMLATDPLDDTVLLNRARGCIERMIEAGLTKYTATDPAIDPPAPGYVLVIDQTRGDASVTAGGADSNRFREMLYWAQDEHPGARIVIKTHPETSQGFREGYFTSEDASDRVTLCTDPISPWALFEGAIAVYTVSSQMGFEAIFAGHKPRVFGQPFYAGWGLTEDEFPITRRQRRLTRAQLFAASMLKYPVWYDPNSDALCDYETAAESLVAQTLAWREDRRGYVVSGMRLWKRAAFKRAFGAHGAITFQDDPSKAAEIAEARECPHLVWASKVQDPADWNDVQRVEDGFLRSTGLGARLVPPASLAVDDLGIYYDPSGPSRLEALIRDRAELRTDQADRARALIRQILKAGVSKYNVGSRPPDLPEGHRILVPGQVEDDASIITGAQDIRTNRALLEAVRAARPDAVIVYKPHPDVEAGLRPGAIDTDGLADIVLTNTNPAEVLSEVNEVWTITSLLGFEALLRDIPVTTLGTPFYAGWGLTTALGAVPDRRQLQVSLEGLVHAALIDYPRYFDPKTGAPCPVEHAVARLADGDVVTGGPALRILAKLQGVLASYSFLWR